MFVLAEFRHESVPGPCFSCHHFLAARLWFFFELPVEVTYYRGCTGQCGGQRGWHDFLAKDQIKECAV
eukprot:1452099-Amphidinium_carterae.1